MIWIVLTLVTVVALFILLGVNGKTWNRRPRQWFCLVGLVWLVVGSVTMVPTGHTGILTTFGKVENKTLEAGMHFKLPIQEVVVMDNRTQKERLTLPCFSSDIQEVEVIYSINYQIQKENAQTIYKTIGEKYYQIVMEPRIEEAVRSVIAKYSAESLIENRDQLSARITSILEENLHPYNIDVVNTAIESLDFSDAFTTAVENKQVAQQNKLKAQTEQEQKTMEEQAAAARQKIAAEAEAAVAVIQAEADANVIKIQAEAAEYAGQKDAAINKAVAETLTDLLVEYYKTKQWDGKLPENYVAGVDSVIPILGGSASAETPARTPAQTPAAN